MAQTERACIAGAIVGAAVGAAIGYLYATDAGAQRRADIARLVDKAIVDADEARRLWLRLKGVWAEYERNRVREDARDSPARAWPPEGAA